MFRSLLVAAAASIAVLASPIAEAQHTHDMGAEPMPGMSSSDSRQLLHFPPMMQAHMLRNMRDHVETLDAILSALDIGDYAKAAKIAKDRLGLDSPAAAACKPSPANATPGSMEAMMAVYMPPPMRAFGLSMHTAASDFADVAARADATHDAPAVLKALSRITPNCVDCHAAYRLR